MARTRSPALRSCSSTLKEAGVVDAGGAGLLEIIRGVRAAVAGEPVPAAPASESAVSVEAMHHELSEFRYCTVFVVEGDALDADELERELERLGDSLLVVGDSTALKVHVHTDDPGAALSLGTANGTIDGVEIADMHRQTLEREERLAAGTLDDLPTLETGVVVVAPGEGNRRLFKNLRATRVIEGGPDDEPVDRGHRGSSRRDPCDRGDRAAEQHERDPQRRAGGRSREQAGSGRADAIRPGGAGRDDRLRPGA